MEERARVVVEPLNDGGGEKCNDRGENGFYYDEDGTKENGEVFPPGEAANERDTGHVAGRERERDGVEERKGGERSAITTVGRASSHVISAVIVIASSIVAVPS